MTDQQTTAKPETCPACHRYTGRGKEQLAKHFRAHPIYGTDFSRPLSETIEHLRTDIVQVRGKLSDIGSAHTGWRERVASVEGLLTCGLMALYYIREEMIDHERRFPKTSGEGASAQQ